MTVPLGDVCSKPSVVSCAIPEMIVETPHAVRGTAGLLMLACSYCLLPRVWRSLDLVGVLCAFVFFLALVIIFWGFDGVGVFHVDQRIVRHKSSPSWQRRKASTNVNHDPAGSVARQLLNQKRKDGDNLPDSLNAHRQNLYSEYRTPWRVSLRDSSSPCLASTVV